MMNMKILKVEYGDLYHTNKSNFYMERTIIYVFGPKRLQDEYQNGKNLQKDFTGWLKIGQTSTTEDQEDKWDAAMKRVKQEQRTGICEPSILLDVFEYPKMSGNLDAMIRRALTDDVYSLESSKLHNTFVNEQKYEIKAGIEFIYGASRKQILSAVAKIERDLIMRQNDEKQLKQMIQLVKRNYEGIFEDYDSDDHNISINFTFYDNILDHLSKDIKGNHTKGRNYATFRSTITKFQKCGYSIKYSIKRNTAIIDFESLEGDEICTEIENMLITIRPSLEITGPFPGSKNPQKIFWRLSKSFDCFDPEEVIEWFTSNMRAMYDFFEQLNNFNSKI